MPVIFLDLKNEGKRALLPVVIDAADIEDPQGRGRLNPMSLELLYRFFCDQRTTFYHMSRQIELNI